MLGAFGKKQEQKSNTIKGYYSYYDSKTGIYSDPMLCWNGHDLVRQVTNLLRNPEQAKNPLLMNAEDYSLFQIGEFDSSTGEMKGVEAPIHIANLHEIRAIIERENAAKGPGALLPT